MLFLFNEVFIKGLIVKIESKDYYVIPVGSDDLFRCSLRGKFKKEFNLKKDKLYALDIAVPGDWVEFENNNDGSGVITKVYDRRNYLSRKAPKIKGASYRGERLEQKIAANIDNFFVITSTASPSFNNKVLDRFIVAGESCGIDVFIIINKSDLENDEIEEWKSLYEDIGYKVFLTSVIDNTGFEELNDVISGKINVFWGQSGVGKSSLLNKLYPDLELLTGRISDYTDRGTHTTVTSLLIKIDNDTYIMDTPGIREIAPFGVKKEDLGFHFKEFEKYIKLCKFNTCTHNHEPGCAVIEAVENEEISVFRYDSYLRILETIEEDIIF